MHSTKQPQSATGASSQLSYIYNAIIADPRTNYPNDPTNQNAVLALLTNTSSQIDFTSTTSQNTILISNYLVVVNAFVDVYYDADVYKFTNLFSPFLGNTTTTISPALGKVSILIMG